MNYKDEHGNMKFFCAPYGKPKPAPEPTWNDLKKQQQENPDKIKRLEQQLDKLRIDAKKLQDQIDEDTVNIGFELEQTVDQLQKVSNGKAFGPGYEKQLDLTLLKNPQYLKYVALKKSHVEQRKEIVEQFDEGVKQWKDLEKQKNDLNNKLKKIGCPNK
jgi:TolA-binding protein